MVNTLTLSPGVTLRFFRDSRFKQGCLSFQLVGPMTRQTCAMNALIPNVLLRGTRAHPSLRAITARLDELYGAAVSPLVRRVGDYQTLGLYCGFMEDRFALPGDAVLSPMLAFLQELLLDSPLENGGFLKEFVESEKRNLISTIESERNDKRVYATNRLLGAMCGGDSFGLPRLGEKEDVAAIDPAGLYAHYRRALSEYPIEIFYVGSADIRYVAEGLAPLLSRLDRSPISLAPQTGLVAGSPVNLTEEMEVSQGKLCLGLTTPITNRHREFPAMQVLNTILGSGMTSKLFQTVREKLSLCYSIGSGYYGSKGLVIISAGIDFDKEPVTRAESLNQLAACQRGEITPEELTAAREAVLSSLRSTHDSPGAIEGYYATAALSGMGLTVEAYIRAIEEVTLEQVVAAANTLTLHSTYFLRGYANETL